MTCATWHTGSTSLERADGATCRVGLPLYSVLGGCASPCNRPYLGSLYNARWEGSVPPSLKEAGAMADPTRERSLDPLARGLAGGSLSRRKVLYATGGNREVYERLQRNAEENGAE